MRRKGRLDVSTHAKIISGASQDKNPDALVSCNLAQTGVESSQQRQGDPVARCGPIERQQTDAFGGFPHDFGTAHSCTPQLVRRSCPVIALFDLTLPGVRESRGAGAGATPVSSWTYIVRATLCGWAIASLSVRTGMTQQSVPSNSAHH